jgi:hypothetical protein
MNPTPPTADTPPTVRPEAVAAWLIAQGPTVSVPLMSLDMRLSRDVVDAIQVILTILTRTQRHREQVPDVAYALLDTLPTEGPPTPECAAVISRVVQAYWRLRSPNG